MKKLIALFALAITSATYLNAQTCPTPVPWYTNGNTIGTGTNIFGTLDANDILINGNSSQIGIVTGNHTSGNVGNYEIGISGTLPLNKLLVENGAINTSTSCTGPARPGPYTDLCNLNSSLLPSFSPSDIGIYSYSNNQSSGSNNVGVAAITDASQAFGIGSLNYVTNAATSIGQYTQVDVTSSSQGYGGFFLVNGTTSNLSSGVVILAKGSTNENDGLGATAIGASANVNYGVHGTSKGCVNTTWFTPGGNVAVYGDASSQGVTNAINYGVSGISSNPSSLNMGFMGMLTVMDHLI